LLPLFGTEGGRRYELYIHSYKVGYFGANTMKGGRGSGKTDGRTEGRKEALKKKLETEF
jgi:hypothetical protein